MFFFSFFFKIILVFPSLSDLFLVLTLQYAVFLPNTIHTLKQQQEGILSICHMPSSVLESTVTSGLQYFFHCSQLSCTVLCNFHMDVYDYLLPQKFRNSVDRDYCAMENKSGKCIFVLKHLCILYKDLMSSHVRIVSIEKCTACLGWEWETRHICTCTLDGSRYTHLSLHTVRLKEQKMPSGQQNNAILLVYELWL